MTYAKRILKVYANLLGSGCVRLVLLQEVMSEQ
jgi:hypothetical protein